MESGSSTNIAHDQADSFLRQRTNADVAELKFPRLCL